VAHNGFPYAVSNTFVMPDGSIMS